MVATDTSFLASSNIIFGDIPPDMGGLFSSSCQKQPLSVKDNRVKIIAIFLIIKKI
jgi:hypothetical protein